MYSSNDLERFYFQYQTEFVPKGISIQDFCVKNSVPYNIFLKWYKDTRNKIVEVQVDGFPPESVRLLSPPPLKLPENVVLASSPTRICVELRLSTGLHVSQKN
ncbi:MAG: hypothetical protein RRY72_00530, partial [Bacteroides sp.]